MGEALVECVPNISEGTDLAKVAAVVDAARGVDGCAVLSSEPDSDYNRTVVTLAGDPAAVGEAAFRLIETASVHIDMRSHRGNHARLGAVDVCPFVPLQAITLEQCAQLAKDLANRVSTELGIPVYLYGAAAQSTQRSNHSLLRKGEYEALQARLTEGAESLHDDSTRLPDLGPFCWNEKIATTGATIIGARGILVAYNVNLKEKDARISGTIGKMVRQTGPIIKNQEGERMEVSGMLAKVQGMGFPLEEHGISQVSMNLQDISVTPMHVVFETIKWIAGTYGVEVTGSELVGLAPLSAFTQAGAWYRPDVEDEDALVEAAIKGMGLDDLCPFDADKRIIERAVARGV